MSDKKHHGGPAPVPPGNQPHQGPPAAEGTDETKTPHGSSHQPPRGPGMQEHTQGKDKQGDYTGTGEHSRVQPGPKNDN